MSRRVITGWILLLCAILVASGASAQEGEGLSPIRWNPVVANHRTAHTAARTTATLLTLPFFDDFSGNSNYPDSNKWTDFEVYINNTMGSQPPSRGVATFDDLDVHGTPYDSFSNLDFRPADSLTSQPIDLSGNVPGDSIYLSFFYQPQGNGFYPLPQDSLMLYLKDKYGDYERVWIVPGSTLQPFQQVMIPITDTLFLHNSFQFRFVNIAALNWSDAIWNIDYVRLDKNRSAGDTTISDVAFTADPTFLLNDYTSMPYNQFMANPAGEMVTQVTDTIANDTSLNQNINYFFGVVDKATGTPLTTGTPGTVFIPGYLTEGVTEPLSIPIGSLPVYPANTNVVFQSKYYLQSTATTGPTVNDTIVKDQVFSNYLAYDDGTAEKSYYLTLFPTLPAELAVEYHLNQPDTLRGISIYFGRQIPFAYNKFFYIYIYSALAGVNGEPADVKLDSIELATPGYADTVNHFWTFTFPNGPLLLPAGTFYTGVLQPAESGSDSLYIGFDVNRVGDNHVFYNVLGSWNHSQFTGALMIHPLLGAGVTASKVAQVSKKEMNWQMSPNPATDKLQFEFDGDKNTTYNIADMEGRTVQQGNITNGGSADISKLAPGMYFVTLVSKGETTAAKKLVKL